jgi:ABC-type nickel/cobalt efflux system permease component RcnA
MSDSLHRFQSCRRGSRWAASFVALACLTGFTVPASAHPLGNFTINHLVKVRQIGDALRVRYALDIAEIPTFAIMRSRSANGVLGSAGLRAWANSEVAIVTEGLGFEADGERLPLQPLGAASVRTRPGAGGLPTLYWLEDFVLRPGTARSLRIDDRTYPDRIGWKDVVIAPASDPTDDLTHYPTAMLTSPRDVSAAILTRQATGIWAAAPPTGQRGRETASTSQVRSNALADMLARGPTSALVVVLTLLAAIGLGALHALEPGHGKTLLAVSLVGARATPKQALLLATGLTLAHTAGVLLLGLALLSAAQWIVPEAIYPWITVASGVAVIWLGANALARLIRSRRGSAHDHDHGYEHEGAHGHSHVIPENAPLSFRNVMVIAMGGNIAPCPAALVVMLTALTLHQLGYGLAIIVAFGVGLAAVLTGLGIAVVRGAALIARSQKSNRALAYGPLISAAVISLIGAVMFGQGLASGIIQVPAWSVIGLTIAAIAGYAIRPGHVHGHVHSGSPHAA